MKIKDGYLLDEIGGQKVAVSLDQSEDKYSGVIKMNEVGAFLWEKLQEDCTVEELVAAVTAEYEVDEDTARADIEKFVSKLKENRILE